MDLTYAIVVGVLVLVLIAIIAVWLTIETRREFRSRKGPRISEGRVAIARWPLMTLLDMWTANGDCEEIVVSYTTFRYMDMVLGGPAFRQVEYRGIPVRIAGIADGCIRFNYRTRGFHITRWYDPKDLTH